MSTLGLLGFTYFISLVSSQTAPFSQEEINDIFGYFTNNINISGGYEGAIIAATANSNPNYYFHWMRDAGLCMRTLFETTSSSIFSPYFQSYVKWVQNAQVAEDPNNIDIRGEPKWFIQGTPYNQGWCRPQNDGPGIRAYVLSLYGQWALENGQSKYVSTYLMGNSSNGAASCDPNAARKDCGYYGITEQECQDNGCCWSPVDPNPENLPWCFFYNGGSYSGLIPTDLEYVQSVASSSGTCDLWEEYQAVTFFTSMLQRKGLYEAAILANKLGYKELAQSYQQTIAALNSTITQMFYEPSQNLVIQSNERTWDSAVILGSIYGDTGDLFGPTDSAILNTAAQTRQWAADNFPINTQDDNEGIPGTLIARYAYDKYNGCYSNGGNAGHAWILSTNAFASLYYLNGMELAKALRQGTNWQQLLNPEKLRLYAKHFNFDMPEIAQKVLQFAEDWEIMTREEKQTAAEFTVRSLTQSGDNMLTRVHYHVSPCSCRMTEQICETTGNEIGATDLSWSYATLLSAWYERSLLTEVYGFEPFPEFRKFYGMKRLDGFGDTNCNGCNDGCSD